MYYFKRMIIGFIVALVLAFAFYVQDKSFGYEETTREAERVHSLRVHISDLHMLYTMGYPVDRMEAYGVYMDLNNACINYQGVDYNLVKCIRSASLDVNGY